MCCQQAKTGSTAAVRALDDAARQALDGVPQIVWVSDAEGAVVFLNQAANEFWGRPATPLRGRDFEAFVHADDRALVCDAWIAALARGESFEHQLRLIDSNGAPRWFTVKAKPWPAEAGSAAQYWMGVAQIELGDATADSLLTDGRRGTPSQLHQSKKMEAVGRMADDIASDFNNLLTVVNGYSDMLVEMLPEGHPGREPALIIRHAAERAAMLTTQLHSLTRESDPDLCVLDLHDEIIDDPGQS